MTAASSAAILAFPAAPAALSRAAAELWHDGEREPETARAYAHDWRAWCHWLADRGIAPDRAGDMELASHLGDLYLVELATAPTLRRRRAGIEAVRRDHGLEPLAGPETKRILKGAAKRDRDRELKQARPLLREQLRRMVEAIPDDARGRRDRALLLIGWHGALRRSEIAGADWRDWSAPAPPLVEIAVLRLRRSKHRAGVETARLPECPDGALCPVLAAGAWREAVRAGSDDPLFPAASRSGVAAGRRIAPEAVGRVLRRRMAAAGLDIGGYSAHSLRAGAITQWAADGVSPLRIKEYARLKSLAMVERYVRDLAAVRGAHPSLAVYGGRA